MLSSGWGIRLSHPSTILHLTHRCIEMGVASGLHFSRRCVASSPLVPSGALHSAALHFVLASSVANHPFYSAPRPRSFSLSHFRQSSLTGDFFFPCPPFTMTPQPQRPGGAPFASAFPQPSTVSSKGVDFIRDFFHFLLCQNAVLSLALAMQQHIMW